MKNRIFHHRVYGNKTFVGFYRGHLGMKKIHFCKGHMEDEIFIGLYQKIRDKYCIFGTFDFFITL